MNEQRLEMKYHPAKKEVFFRRIISNEDGKEAEEEVGSGLRTYMNDRGNFVLQNQGEKFFKAIADAFNGKKAVQVDVITTRLDYEDFEQMVEHYNKNIEITATLLAELPDMDAIYHEVKKHGEESIGILEEHLEAINDIPFNDERFKDCVDDFTENIDTAKSSIRGKMKKMTNDHINLCFAGVYSAGKSTLINAILGYQILPEAMESTTAKMFRIESPQPGKPVQIDFAIKDGAKNHGVILSWDEKSRCFVFGAGPTEENATRMVIQGIIDANKSAERHDQMLKILEALNSRSDVNVEIKVYFPVPLDSEHVHFAIYDTPGTDSNFEEHQEVLQSALSEQTHSILVFVAAPNKMEGKGNSALLSCLKVTEKKDSKPGIDLDRSLFVINFADTVDDPQEREAFREKEITDESDRDFSIKLAAKKVFFTSAKIAYAAKAHKNRVQTKCDEFEIKKHSGTISDECFGRYFQQNRFAASECATQKMIEASTEALEKAEQEGNTLSAVFICSGLYALEEEIKTYGKKYATAVRAFAIIESVDDALAEMKKSIGKVKEKNEENLDKIEREIKTLSEQIKRSIEEVRGEHEDNEPWTDHFYALNLGPDYLYDNIFAPIKKFVDGLLKERFFGWVNPEFKEEDKDKISKNIDETLKKYTSEFFPKRRALLEKLRDAFIADVKAKIQSNEDIPDEAKAYICKIRAPEIERFSECMKKMVKDRYKANEYNMLFIFHNIDKAGFIEDVAGKLIEIATDMAEGFKKDFETTLTNVWSAIETEFTQNKERYSRLMRAKLADKEAMAQLGEKIAATASKLEGCQKKLETTIWREKK